VLVVPRVRLFSLIFFKGNEANASKVLEKRELKLLSQYQVLLSYLEMMKLIRKIIDKAIFTGRSYRSNIFITRSRLCCFN